MLLVVLAVVVVACGGGQTGVDSPVTTATAAPSSTAPSSTGPASTVTTVPAPGVDKPPPDPGRPIAPDFELTLADGSLFRLSAEIRPVFLVFWAEW